MDITKASPNNEPESNLTLIGFSQVFNPNLEVDFYGKKSQGISMLMTQPKPNMAMAAQPTFLTYVLQPNSATTATTNESIITKPDAAASDDESLLAAVSCKEATFVNCTFNFGR